MPELRQDLFRNSWVVIATDVELKPRDFPINRSGSQHVITGSFCPFCEGKETTTPPELAAYRQEGTEPNTPGWQVRAVPNKYSAFSPEGSFNVQNDSIFTRASGFGQHEVIVETPQHDLEFHELPLDQIELVFKMLRQRYNTLAQDQRMKYLQIYKNRGLFAGASLSHSHSQMVGLPMVPEVCKILPRYYEEHQTCLMCETLEQELKQEKRIVWQSEHFVILCPYASRYSYETWIVPRRHSEHFGEITDQEISSLAVAVQGLLTTLLDKLENTSYNIVYNTAPINVDHQPGFHWNMEITPRLVVTNGIEMGTGYNINPVSPEIAARVLREKIGV
jgi:UDPglucose--hexose-1-phosphate uridylyltransferase